MRSIKSIFRIRGRGILMIALIFHFALHFSLEDALEKMEDNEEIQAEEELELDYVPDLSMLEPLPFDDGSLAKQFEAGLDTMESWREYTKNLEEREIEMQRALEAEAIANSVVPEKQAVPSPHKQSSRTHRSKKRKPAKQIVDTKIDKPVAQLEVIVDDSGSEVQSSSSYSNEWLSGVSNSVAGNSDYEMDDNDEEDEDLASNLPPYDMELSLADDETAALDAEIEAEERQLRFLVH